MKPKMITFLMVAVLFCGAGFPTAHAYTANKPITSHRPTSQQVDKSSTVKVAWRMRRGGWRRPWPTPRPPRIKNTFNKKARPGTRIRRTTTGRSGTGFSKATRRITRKQRVRQKLGIYRNSLKKGLQHIKKVSLETKTVNRLNKLLSRKHISSNKLKARSVSKQLKTFLGKDYRIVTNKAGDKVYISKDGNRRVRFDIKNPHPHPKPHAHVEQKNANGNFKPVSKKHKQIYFRE